MDDKLQDLLEKIRQLEHELIAEIQEKERKFFYEIHEKKVRFEKEVKNRHKGLVKKVRYYLYDAAFLNILTAPVIWTCLIPAVLMDLVLSFFQYVCFPVYGIPKVRRGDYIVIDRHYLSYLNIIEKLNCVYCGYVNGVIGYAREVAGRTEQYWCPIKHARRIKSLHSRYNKFLDYGDGDEYRNQIEEVRRSFEDLSSTNNKKKD